MDMKTLQEALRRGESFDYLLFWGHRQKRTGIADASCLSQWFAARFVVEGVAYPTAEHWMMASKASLFGDVETHAAILEASDPRDVKALGRQVRCFDHAEWTRARYRLVLRGNVEKFSQNPPLREYLLSTAPKILVEASPHDNIWGIGLAASDPDATDPAKWRGTNLLGFALMETRTQLGSALGAPTE